MRFVGVDLAWGDRRPTGLAVLDDRGRLLHVSAATSDESILATVASYVEGDCLVAIDAPLVVNNPTGNRPAEADLNRDFRAFEAGTHPSNTGKPEFAGSPRGARLAEAMRLDIDPDSKQSRRAIEVYPHPATVALFRLGRTLKYKDKKGRAFDDLRTELQRLMDLLEGLEDAATPLHLTHRAAWKELVAQVDAATRKSELRKIEDQVDAVVCAYVALFVEREPEHTTTYGDLASGYIVTPTLPEGHTPAPRPSRAETAHARILDTYAAKLPALRKASDVAVQLVTEILDDAGINYLSITGRAKSVASFAGKSVLRAGDGPRYTDPLSEMADQVGVRVVTYLQSDVVAVVDLLASQFQVLADRDKGQETASRGRWGYASRHLDLALDPGDELEAGHAPLRGQQFEVQIRTVLQHAWAEFEHDIRYKGTIPDEHAPDLDRRLTLAAGLLELADREFSTIRDRLQSEMAVGPAVPPETDLRIGARDLATYLVGRYADAGWSKTDHYVWISGLLHELGIISPDQLAAVLREVDSDTITAQMAYKYPAGAVRRLDDDLLALYGERYIGLAGNADRVDLLASRLAKIRA